MSKTNKNINKLIIHISGSQGSGKSTIGNFLHKKYKNKIYVKDLDDLFNEFMNSNKFSIDGYQKYIYKYILDHKQKHIVFVGLNRDMGNSNKYYQLKANYKFYIKIPINILLERLFYREVDEIYKNKKYIFGDYLNNPDRIVKKLTHNINLNTLKKETIKNDIKFKKMNYVFLKTDDIIKKITRLI